MFEDLKLRTLPGVVALALLWLGETWFPFYAQFTANRRERLRHDTINLGLGLFNSMLMAL